jgi:hypothetical protein
VSVIHVDNEIVKKDTEVGGESRSRRGSVGESTKDAMSLKGEGGK